jgi:hypothetical protein
MMIDVIDNTRHSVRWAWHNARLVSIFLSYSFRPLEVADQF